MAVQVRVNEETHAIIRDLAKESGESMQRIIDKAVERYKRELFLESLNEDFKNLRENETEWACELEERRLWENTLLDGVEKRAMFTGAKSGSSILTRRSVENRRKQDRL